MNEFTINMNQPSSSGKLSPDIFNQDERVTVSELIHSVCVWCKLTISSALKSRVKTPLHLYTVLSHKHREFKE